MDNGTTRLLSIRSLFKSPEVYIALYLHFTVSRLLLLHAYNTIKLEASEIVLSLSNHFFQLSPNTVKMAGISQFISSFNFQRLM